MIAGITGATGHIGYAICRELILQGFDVVAFIRNESKLFSHLPVKVVKGDILDKTTLLSFMDQCDVIFHTAADIELGYKFSQRLYDINVTGIRNVLEAAKETGIKKVIHFSSVHAFRHRPQELPLDETREFVDNHAIFYDQTKRDGHLLALEAARNGLNVVILCPTSVLGMPDYRPSKIGKAIIDIYRGSVPAVVKGGFDFVDVKDVAQAAVAAIEKGRSGEAYILGGEYHTIKQLSDWVLEARGVKKRLKVLPVFIAYLGLPFVKLYAALSGKSPLYDKPYLDILEDGNRNIITKKAVDELGMKTRSLKETIFTMVAWLKENRKV